MQSGMDMATVARPRERCQMAKARVPVLIEAANFDRCICASASVGSVGSRLSAREHGKDPPREACMQLREEREGPEGDVCGQCGLGAGQLCAPDGV